MSKQDYGTREHRERFIMRALMARIGSLLDGKALYALNLEPGTDSYTLRMNTRSIMAFERDGILAQELTVAGAALRIRELWEQYDTMPPFDVGQAGHFIFDTLAIFTEITEIAHEYELNLGEVLKDIS